MSDPLDLPAIRRALAEDAGDATVIPVTRFLFDYLLAEIERLRQVEAAARRVSEACEMTGMMSTRTDRAVSDLRAALDAALGGGR